MDLRVPRTALDRLADLVLPPRCLACGAAGQALCEACFDGLVVLDRRLCPRCGAPRQREGEEHCRECRARPLAFASARAAVGYTDGIKALMGQWKERGVRSAGPMAAALVLTVVPKPQVEAVTWVPPDRDRTLRRGGHPAEWLARTVAGAWGLPAEPWLARRAGSRRQRTLARSARQANVQGAFRAVRGSGSPPRTLALVDDVYTTGATVSAAAAALLAAGTEHVEVVTLARAIR